MTTNTIFFPLPIGASAGGGAQLTEIFIFKYLKNSKRQRYV